MYQQNITLIQVMKPVFIIQKHITITICLQQLKSTFDERKLAEIKVLKEWLFRQISHSQKKGNIFLYFKILYFLLQYKWKWLHLS